MTIDTGSTAWILLSTATLTLVAPGLGLFYGGMSDKKNILSTIAYGILVYCMVTLVWSMIGFSLAFGNSTIAKGFIGDCTYCWLRGISQTTESNYAPSVPFAAHFFYQTAVAGMSAILFISALIGRLRTAFIILITTAYILAIYSIVTYWIRNTDGWLNKLGVIDFGGGSFVHIVSGFAALGSHHYLGQGKNKIYKHSSSSISMTLIGTGLLWLGWMGLNGGASTASGQVTAVALTNTQLAACAGALSFAFLQYIYNDSPHVLGICSGAICGLTSITAGAGYVSLWSALVIGCIGSILTYMYCHYKTLHFGEMRDSLDVFGCHGISGAWGSIAAGLFATPDSGSDFSGLFYGGGRQFGVNLLGVVVCAAYGFFVTWMNLFICERLLQPKVPGQEEEIGLDKAAHEDQQPLTKNGIIQQLKQYQKSVLGIQLIQNDEQIMEKKKQQQHEVHTHKSHSERQEAPRNIKSKVKSTVNVGNHETIPISDQVVMQLTHERRAKEQQLIGLIQKHIQQRDKLYKG